MGFSLTATIDVTIRCTTRLTIRNHTNGTCINNYLGVTINTRLLTSAIDTFCNRHHLTISKRCITIDGEFGFTRNGSQSRKVFSSIEYMIIIIDTDGIAMLPCVSCSCRKDSLTISTEVFVIIWFFSFRKSNIHHFDSRQRSGVACTKRTAIYRAVVEC